MTSAHIFFIPLILLVGLLLGIVLGRRAALLQIEEEARRQKREADRKTRARPAGESGDAAADVSRAPPR